MTGQLIGHYRILEKIGSGGMGEVYRARDERLGRDVALKLIRPASSTNPDHLRRFEQEARAAAALNHPNILAIYDVGLEGATPYIVSELLRGKTLRTRLSQGALPPRQAADFALQIAHGLTAAHERYIVHRDLKPENLFLTEDGRVKILDFGVAKLQGAPEGGSSIESATTVTKAGAIVGTVAYMSPEQLRGQTVDHRSDIFSFGAILYEMLVGCRAFRGETEVDTMTAVLREEPPQARLVESAVPAGFREIIKHCVDKEPKDRFQSVKDLAFALLTISGSAPGREISLPKLKGQTQALPSILIAALALLSLVLASIALGPQRPALSYARLTSESGTVYSARFASDGQSIVYAAAWNDRPVQIFSTVGPSLLAQPLNLPDANLLAISPTNELAVVLRGTHNGQLETVNGVLARTPMAGGSPREVLSQVRWADWDANGKLAVVHTAEGHSRLEYPIGKVLYQSTGWISHIRFSPHQDKIAFLDHPALWDNRGNVAVVDVMGHARTLAGLWESEEGLAWRPDGKEIWFSAIEKGNKLNLLAVGLSGKTRLLLDLPVGITLQDISPDGRVLVTLNSRRLAMASSPVGSTRDEDLSWHDWDIVKDISPDGRFVLFEDASDAGGPGYSVALRRLDGTMPVQLGDGSAGGLSPDGKWALSISTGTAPQITLLPVGPGQPRIVPAPGLEQIQNVFARFLTDGRIVVNGSESGHSVRCYVVDTARGKPRAVTTEGTLCGPSSPDARLVLGIRDDLSTSIYPLDGGEPRNLSLPIGFEPVQWANSGSVLYGYHENEFPGRIYKLDISTGKETVLQELHPGVPAGIVNIAPVVVNRDGTRFAYSYNQTLSVLYVISNLR